jgi:hypothetical protein
MLAGAADAVPNKVSRAKVEVRQEIIIADWTKGHDRISIEVGVAGLITSVSWQNCQKL